MPTTRYNTAIAFIRAFENLSSDLISTRTPTCTHLFAPGSLSVPPLDNAAFAEHITHLHGIIKVFPVIPKEIIEDEKQNRVVIWASGHPQFYDEVMNKEGAVGEWEYEGEYIFIISIDESGEKIERVIEFVDSKGTERLRGLMERARGNKENKEKREKEGKA